MRRRRGGRGGREEEEEGLENPLGAKIDGAAQPRHRNNFDFNFGSNNNQPLSLKAGKRRPAERAASNENGKDDADSSTGNKRGVGLRQQRGKGLRRCRRRCRHCCCYRCRHRMPPRQLRHYCLCSSSGSSGGSSSGLRRCAVAAAADSRMPSLTPVMFVSS
jgi:hypothetical protein